jgi:hypothetical protein
MTYAHISAALVTDVDPEVLYHRLHDLFDELGVIDKMSVTTSETAVLRCPRAS